MPPGRSRIVIIGHLGLETVQTPFAQRRGPGGSAYYTALGAALSGGDVSLVSTVGSDFSLDTLREVGVDVSHVSVARGASSRFEIKYLPTFADRLIELDLGVGSVLYVPESLDYSDVKFVHVATNLPQTQVELIERLRVVAPAATITADCFDQFVVSYPKATCRVVQSADLVFANLVEYEMIVRMCGDIGTPMVIKKGERGADYRFGAESVTVTAPAVQLVDPTGAGDAFAGAYLVHLARGADQASALTAACRIGAAAVRSFGADSLLSLRRNT